MAGQPEVCPPQKLGLIKGVLTINNPLQYIVSLNKASLNPYFCGGVFFWPRGGGGFLTQPVDQFMSRGFPISRSSCSWIKMVMGDCPWRNLSRRDWVGGLGG